MTTTTTSYHIEVALAGREGTQSEHEGSKREAVRKCKRLVGNGGFGSAGSVTIHEASGEKVKRRLMYQCHVAKRRDGKLYVRQDEL